MAQNRTDNFAINAPKEIDQRRLKNGTTPYASVDEAHSLITYKFRTLTCIVMNAGVPTEYWYKDATTSSSDLVIKNQFGISSVTGLQAALDSKANVSSLSTVATSGSYTDLSNIPTFATVATTGSYSDLSNKPTIPAGQVSSDWNSSSGVTQILNKPNLATVATSGSYNDLSAKPTIPSSTTDLAEGTNLYYTSSRVRTTPLTGFSSTTGTVTAADTVLSGINKLTGNLAVNTAAIGTLSSLTTSANTNLVSAINEVSAVANAAAGGGTVVGDGTVTNVKLSSDVKVGSLASLTTTANTSVVAAINELVSTKVNSSVGVTLTGSQTLTNKTLTSPIINSPTGIVKGDVGLSNVDNTSDLNKPISTATQTALNLKQDAASAVTLTGSQTLTNKTLTSPVINSPTGLVKADVGLGNVDNTSDANKPVSTAQQTALNLKANLASPTLTGTPLSTTASAGTNTTQIATTAFVFAERTNTATLTGKSISGSTNTLSNIPTSSLLTSDTQVFDPTIYATLASPTFTGVLTTPALKITGSSPAVGKILTSDGVGNATWSTPSIGNTALPYRDLIFYDDFNRADTAAGQLGTSTSGSTYDLLGVGPSIGNALSRITNGRWVSHTDGVTNQTSYAIQNTNEVVRNIGAKWKWVAGNGVTSDEAVMIFIVGQLGSVDLAYNCSHIRVTRFAVSFDFFVNGSSAGFTTKTIPHQITIAQDREISANFTFIDNTCYYNVAGNIGYVSDPKFVTQIGKYATWEPFYNDVNGINEISVGAVWVGSTPPEGIVPPPRYQAVTSAATVTPNADTDDAVKITALATNLTLANPTGSPLSFQRLVIRLKDNGTTRTIAYGSQYRAIGVTLPTSTTANKTIYMTAVYNSEDTKWDIIDCKLQA